MLDKNLVEIPQGAQHLGFHHWQATLHLPPENEDGIRSAVTSLEGSEEALD